jgi:hypothetical protein
VESVEAVPCAAAHDAQVLAKPNSSYSGLYDETAVWESGLETCTSYFNGFIGKSYAESELYVDLFFPVAEGWADDDRSLVCLIVPGPDEAQLLGDMANSQR